MAPIRDWSELSDETNGDSDIGSGINWVENMNTSAVNNSSRAEMAETKKWWNDISGVADSTGTGAAYEVTTSQAIVAPLVRGDAVIFKAHVANTGTATLNLNGTGGQPFRAIDGQELAAGQIQAGQLIGAYWNGGQFLALNVGAGTVTVDQLDANTRGLLNDIGDVKPWFTDTAPAGWLICDGSAVSRTTYAELFAAWGTRFGAGDGSTTFNLIDLRGEFLRGLDPTGTKDPDVATRTDRGDGTVGANVGTKQASALQQHGHVDSFTLPDHQHVAQGGQSFATSPNFNVGTAAPTLARPIGGTQNATGGVTSTPSINGSVGNVSGGTASTETRPRNIACNWIVLADAAAAAGAQVNAAGLSGFGYTFDDDPDTTTDPGIGEIRLNGPFATATELAISDQVADTGNADISSVIASLAAVPGDLKGTVKLIHASATERFTLHNVTAVNTSPTGFSRLTLETPPTGFNGSFTAGEAIQVQITEATPGADGEAGPPGPNLGLDYQWNTAISGDPGAGKALLNGAGNVLSISKANRQGKDQSATILSWDDSTNTTNRGVLNVVDTNDAGSNFLNLEVTGTVSDETTHFDVPVTQRSSGDAIGNDALIGILFGPAGDKGLDGGGAGDVVGPASATDEAIALFDGTTGKLIKNSPVTINAANGNVAGVGSLTASAKVTGSEFDASGTGANLLPAGTTGEEPVAVPGMIRYNSTLDRIRGAISTGWDTLAAIATVNAWSAGQKKKMAPLATWSTAWTMAGSLDYRVTAQTTTAINLGLPTDAATHLDDLEAQEGTIWASFGAASGAGFNATWEFPNGAPDVSAGGDFTFYYRVQKGDEVNDSNLHYYLTDLGPWS